MLGSCLFLPACGNKKDGDTLKIGAMIAVTGSETKYGNDMLNAYKMAIDEVNAGGGVLGYKLELAYEDDACDPQQGALAGAKILAADPDYIIGGVCSGAVIPALQNFYDAGKLMLVSGANSTRIIDLALPQTFMVNSPGNHQIDKLIDLLNDLGVKTVAVIHQGDDFSANLSEICDEKLPPAGFQIVTTEIMQKGEQDVSAIVNKVRTSGAEIVMWCGYYADGSNLIKQLRNGGYPGYICVGDGSINDGIIEGSGPQGDGVFALSAPYVKFTEGGMEYFEKYKKLYNGLEPTPVSSIYYDTIMLLADGIRRAGATDTDEVIKAIEANNYQGLSGNLAFAPDHTLQKSNFIVLKINAGAAEFELYNISN
jgi:branched-chain amino acid transport system substrate-binding protein